MNIPVFQNNQMVEQSGKLTNEQQLWFDSLIQSMQAALSDNGWTVPTHTTADITELAKTMPAGTIYFDTDIAKLKVITAARIITPPTPAVIETITSV